MKFNIPDKIYFYIAPHYSVRHHLTSDVGYVIKKYNLHGKLLDIGCGEKPYEHLFKDTKYTGIDFKNYSPYKGNLSKSGPDMFFDDNYSKKSVLPFKNNNFDIICAFQTLEHVSNPQKLFKEMCRILKINGFILLTVPFIWGLHEKPNDYFRYTGYSINNLAIDNHAKIIYEKKEGGLFSVIENLIQNYLSELNNRSKYYYVLTVPLYSLVLFFSYISVIIEKHVKSSDVFLNYIFLIKKIK